MLILELSLILLRIEVFCLTEVLIVLLSKKFGSSVGGWVLKIMNIMISSDGSLKENNIGFGVLLRNKDGNVIDCAYGGCYPISVDAHEMQGVELGLKLAIENYVPRIHASVDIMAIFLLLSNVDPHPP